MSLFNGAERKVETHKTGITNKYDEFGRKIVNIPEKQEVVEEQVTAKIIQGPETQKPELSEGEKAYREANMQRSVYANKTSENLKVLSENIKNGVLENVLTSVYYDALFLDDYFKEYNSSVIQENVHKYLQEKGGYKFITEAYQETKSPLIKAIIDICEETSKEITDRKLNDIKEKKEQNEFNIELFKFDMNDEEKNKLDYNKESIGLKQISEKIKGKVLDVVKEEKKREAEHTELMDEIESELSDDPEVNDAESVAEALNSIFINNVNIEEGTLFNSLLRTNYKKVIESGYEALDLNKVSEPQDLTNELDNISLENLLVDGDDIKHQVLNTNNMKDIFNNFMDKVEEQTDFGNDDMTSVIEAFNFVMDDFFKTANDCVTRQDINMTRNDFRTIQEAFSNIFDNMDYVDEGALIDKAIKIDNKVQSMVYRGICKAFYNNPKKLQQQIDFDKNSIEILENELKRRKDEPISKTISRMVAQCGCFILPGGIGGIIMASFEELTPKMFIKQAIRYNKLFIKVGERRLKEMEALSKIAKESFDDIDNFDISEEEIKELVYEYNNITEEGMKDVANKVVDKAKQLKNIKAIDKIKEKLPQGNKKATKEGVDCDSKDCKEGVETKKIDTEFDMDSLRGKKAIKEEVEDVFEIDDDGEIIDEGFIKRFRDNYNDIKNAQKDPSAKTTQITNLINNAKTVKQLEGIEKSLATNISFGEKEIQKETDPKRKAAYKKHIQWLKTDCKKLIAKRKKELSNNKVTKEAIDSVLEEYMDLIDMEEDIEEINEAAGHKFTFRNFITIIKNCSKGKKNINNIHPGLLKMVDNCKTVEDIKYLQRDLSAAQTMIKKNIENGDEETKKQWQEHKEWLENTYKPALSKKKKELSDKQAVKEAVEDILEECVDILDDKLVMHEKAEQSAIDSVLEHYMGRKIIIPIMKKSDSQLDGLYLPYKMKHVLESLIMLTNKYENSETLNVVEEAIKTNKENVNYVLESFKNIPSTPVYKINYFNTFNDLLSTMENNITELSSIYENLDFKEYDYYDNDLFFENETDDIRVITESFDDDSTTNNDSFCIDMDFILADTLSKYTLLETMYTLQLESFNYNSLKKITNNLLNK